MSDSQTQRPDLAPTLIGAELLRWYWLKIELISLARHLDVATCPVAEPHSERGLCLTDGAGRAS